jgi:hypothetical protein
MRTFWSDCRRALTVPSLPVSALGIGIVMAANTHEGLPLDVLHTLITASCAMVAAVLTLVLLLRIPWIRQRKDYQASHRLPLGEQLGGQSVRSASDSRGR